MVTYSISFPESSFWKFSKCQSEFNQIVPNNDSLFKIFTRSRHKSDLGDSLWWKLGDGSVLCYTFVLLKLWL